ncbi:OmpA family protein [Roseobacter sp. HKCC-CH-9208]|uniref:OmpA family protein n=1 Tax=Roseobacter sp. HKCC-CH-9208 TaxID=3120339 RepID=UPI0030EC9FF4
MAHAVRFLAIGLLAFVPQFAAAQSGSISGRVQPGIWIDPDCCMHWVADGGLEGYMEGRVNPQTGMPVCMRVNACAVTNSDVFFATDSAHLTANGRAQLEQFFRSAGAFAYAIYGHSDARTSDEYNIRLSQARAESVANVAHGVGACVAREIGYGERRPIAPNDSTSNMQRNRRVEIVCYR